MKQKISIILFFLLAISVHAATIYEVPEDKGFFTKTWERVTLCKWHISCYFEHKLGATITVISGTDRITDSRGTINTNYANINSELLGILTPARLTATSTSASSTLQWGLEIYQRALAIGISATTTIRATATSSFNGGVSSTGTLDIQSSTATSTFANGIALTRGCITMPDGNCAITSGLTGSGTANQIAYYSAATALTSNSNLTFSATPGGFIATNGTTTNATTTSFQISGLASTSQAIIGALGVGISTTTQRNVQIAGAVQIGGSVSINTNLTIASTTGSCTGCIQPIVRTATASGPTTSGGQATLLVSCVGDEYVIGGGGSDTEVTIVVLQQSNPEGSQSWRIRYYATAAAPANTMTAYAVCAKP